jgi:hypothetical protein
MEFGSKITRVPASLTNHATKLLGYTISQKALERTTMHFDGIRNAHLE